MGTSLAKIFTLPRIVTSAARESQFAMEWWKRNHAEAKAQAEVAWKIYDDAIEAEKPHTEIEELGRVAEIFDDIRAGAWLRLECAKRDYLNNVAN